MTDFYSHRTFIGTVDPPLVSIHMARAASAYKVLSEALQCGEKTLLLQFPEPSTHDGDHTVVYVYGFGDQDDE